MTVDIPPELQHFVHQAIDIGGYQSESAVVGEALRLLQLPQRRIKQMRREIQSALNRVNRHQEFASDDDGMDALIWSVQE